MIREGQIWKSKLDGTRWEVSAVTEKGVKCLFLKADGKTDKYRISGSDVETFLQYHDLEK